MVQADWKAGQFVWLSDWLHKLGHATVTNGIYTFYIGLHTHIHAHIPVQSDSLHQSYFFSHLLEHFQQIFVEKFLNKDLWCDSCHLNFPGRHFLWQKRKVFLAEIPFTVDGTHNIIVNDDFPPMKAEVYVHMSVCVHEREGPSERFLRHFPFVETNQGQHVLKCLLSLCGQKGWWRMRESRIL